MDAAVLLIALDDLVFRFDPLTTPGAERLPVGVFEGAFVRLHVSGS